MPCLRKKILLITGLMLMLLVGCFSLNDLQDANLQRWGFGPNASERAHQIMLQEQAEQQQ
jgi:hypothetical protein